MSDHYNQIRIVFFDTGNKIFCKIFYLISKNTPLLYAFLIVREFIRDLVNSILSFSWILYHGVYSLSLYNLVSSRYKQVPVVDLRN